MVAGQIVVIGVCTGRCLLCTYRTGFNHFFQLFFPFQAVFYPHLFTQPVFGFFTQGVFQLFVAVLVCFAFIVVVTIVIIIIVIVVVINVLPAAVAEDAPGAVFILAIRSFQSARGHGILHAVIVRIAGFVVIVVPVPVAVINPEPVVAVVYRAVYQYAFAHGHLNGNKYLLVAELLPGRQRKAVIEIQGAVLLVYLEAQLAGKGFCLAAAAAVAEFGRKHMIAAVFASFNLYLHA